MWSKGAVCEIRARMTWSAAYSHIPPLSPPQVLISLFSVYVLHFQSFQCPALPGFQQSLVRTAVHCRLSSGSLLVRAVVRLESLLLCGFAWIRLASVSPVLVWACLIFHYESFPHASVSVQTVRHMVRHKKHPPIPFLP